MPQPNFFTDDNQDEARAATLAAENSRTTRLKQLGDAIAEEAAQRSITSSQGIDQAIRGSYASAIQPAAPTDVSQDPSGAQNLTSGQTQVQSVPYNSDAVTPPQSPIGAVKIPQVSSSALASQSIPTSAAPIPPPPPATSIPASTPNSGQPEAAQVAVPQPAAQTGPQPNLPAASPFDTPQFQTNLAAHLAQVPGAGQELLNIKAQRDGVITQVMQMIGNGQTDEARYVAAKNGLAIPDQFYQNSDLAQGMALAQKAYPDEPDKGQNFYKAFIAAPGDLQSRTQAGMAVAGTPTPLAQRELAKAMALAQFNSTIPKPFVGPGGSLMMVSPGTSTATPVTMNGTGAPVNVVAGAGLHMGRPQPKFMNVGGRLYDTEKHTIVVEKNIDPAKATLDIINKLISNGMSPKEAENQARDVVNDLHNNPNGPPPPSAPVPVPPKPSLLQQWFGGQSDAAPIPSAVPVTGASPAYPANPAPEATQPAVPQQAIDYLRSNPALAPQFEQKYGVPAAQYLGQ